MDFFKNWGSLGRVAMLKHSLHHATTIRMCGQLMHMRAKLVYDELYLLCGDVRGRVLCLCFLRRLLLLLFRLFRMPPPFFLVIGNFPFRFLVLLVSFVLLFVFSVPRPSPGLVVSGLLRPSLPRLTPAISALLLFFYLLLLLLLLLWLKRRLKRRLKSDHQFPLRLCARLVVLTA